MVGRHSSFLVTKKSLRNSDSNNGRRLRQVVQTKNLDDTVGLSRKEEQELNKALYASLQENRRSKVLPGFMDNVSNISSIVTNSSSNTSGGKGGFKVTRTSSDGGSTTTSISGSIRSSSIKKSQKIVSHRKRSSLPGRILTKYFPRQSDLKGRPCPAKQAHHITENRASRYRASMSIDESSQDSVKSSTSCNSGSKRKIHAQRKFAQGCSLPGMMNCSPVKLTTPAVKMLSSKVPKTEDFLTFLCLRGSSILPPHLDFFNFSREEPPSCEESSRSVLYTIKNQREITPDSSSTSSGANDEVVETANVTTPTMTGRIGGGLLAKRSAARASAGTPETARGIVSLRQGLQRKVSTSSSSSLARFPASSSSCLLPVAGLTNTPLSRYRNKFYFTPEKSSSPRKASGVRPGEFTPPSLLSSTSSMNSTSKFSPLVYNSSKFVSSDLPYGSQAIQSATSSSSSLSTSTISGAHKRKRQFAVSSSTENTKVTSNHNSSIPSFHVIKCTRLVRQDCFAPNIPTSFPSASLLVDSAPLSSSSSSNSHTSLTTSDSPKPYCHSLEQTRNLSSSSKSLSSKSRIYSSKSFHERKNKTGSALSPYNPQISSKHKHKGLKFRYRKKIHDRKSALEASRNFSSVHDSTKNNSLQESFCDRSDFLTNPSSQDCLCCHYAHLTDPSVCSCSIENDVCCFLHGYGQSRSGHVFNHVFNPKPNVSYPKPCHVSNHNVSNPEPVHVFKTKPMHAFNPKLLHVFYPKPVHVFNHKPVLTLSPVHDANSKPVNISHLPKSDTHLSTCENVIENYVLDQSIYPHVLCQNSLISLGNVLNNCTENNDLKIEDTSPSSGRFEDSVMSALYSDFGEHRTFSTNSDFDLEVNDCRQKHESDRNAMQYRSCVEYGKELGTGENNFYNSQDSFGISDQDKRNLNFTIGDDNVTFSVIPTLKIDKYTKSKKYNSLLRIKRIRSKTNYKCHGKARSKDILNERGKEKVKKRYCLVKEVPKVKIKIIRRHSVKTNNVSPNNIASQASDAQMTPGTTSSKPCQADFQNEFLKMLQADGVAGFSKNKMPPHNTVLKPSVLLDEPKSTSSSSHKICRNQQFYPSRSHIVEDEFQNNLDNSADFGANFSQRTQPLSGLVNVRLFECNDYLDLCQSEETLDLSNPEFFNKAMKLKNGVGNTVAESDWADVEGLSKSNNIKSASSKTYSPESLPKDSPTEIPPFQTNTRKQNLDVANKSVKEPANLADSITLRDKVISAFAKFNRKEIITSKIEVSKGSSCDPPDIVPESVSSLVSDHSNLDSKVVDKFFDTKHHNRYSDNRSVKKVCDKISVNRISKNKTFNRLFHSKFISKLSDKNVANKLSKEKSFYKLHDNKSYIKSSHSKSAYKLTDLKYSKLSEDKTVYRFHDNRSVNKLLDNRSVNKLDDKTSVTNHHNNRSVHKLPDRKYVKKLSEYKSVNKLTYNNKSLNILPANRSVNKFPVNSCVKLSDNRSNKLPANRSVNRLSDNRSVNELPDKGSVNKLHGNRSARKHFKNKYVKIDVKKLMKLVPNKKVNKISDNKSLNKLSEPKILQPLPGRHYVGKVLNDNNKTHTSSSVAHTLVRNYSRKTSSWNNCSKKGKMGSGNTCSKTTTKMDSGNTCCKTANKMGSGNTCSKTTSKMVSGNTCSKTTSKEGSMNTCSKTTIKMGSMNTCSKTTSKMGSRHTCPTMLNEDETHGLQINNSINQLEVIDACTETEGDKAIYMAYLLDNSWKRPEICPSVFEVSNEQDFRTDRSDNKSLLSGCFSCFSKEKYFGCCSKSTQTDTFETSKRDIDSFTSSSTLDFVKEGEEINTRDIRKENSAEDVQENSCLIKTCSQCQCLFHKILKTKRPKIKLAGEIQSVKHSSPSKKEQTTKKETKDCCLRCSSDTSVTNSLKFPDFSNILYLSRIKSGNHIPLKQQLGNKKVQTRVLDAGSPLHQHSDIIENNIPPSCEMFKTRFNSGESLINKKCFTQKPNADIKVLKCQMLDSDVPTGKLKWPITSYVSASTQTGQKTIAKDDQNSAEAASHNYRFVEIQFNNCDDSCPEFCEDSCVKLKCRDNEASNNNIPTSKCHYLLSDKIPQGNHSLYRGHKNHNIFFSGYETHKLEPKSVCQTPKMANSHPGELESGTSKCSKNALKNKSVIEHPLITHDTTLGLSELRPDAINITDIHKHCSYLEATFKSPNAINITEIHKCSPCPDATSQSSDVNITEIHKCSSCPEATSQSSNAIITEIPKSCSCPKANYKIPDAINITETHKCSPCIEATTKNPDAINITDIHKSCSYKEARSKSPICIKLTDKFLIQKNFTARERSSIREVHIPHEHPDCNITTAAENTSRVSEHDWDEITIAQDNDCKDLIIIEEKCASDSNDSFTDASLCSNDWEDFVIDLSVHSRTHSSSSDYYSSSLSTSPDVVEVLDLTNSGKSRAPNVANKAAVVFSCLSKRTPCGVQQATVSSKPTPEKDLSQLSETRNKNTSTSDKKDEQRSLSGSENQVKLLHSTNIPFNKNSLPQVKSNLTFTTFREVDIISETNKLSSIEDRFEKIQDIESEASQIFPGTNNSFQYNHLGNSSNSIRNQTIHVSNAKYVTRGIIVDKQHKESYTQKAPEEVSYRDEMLGAEGKQFSSNSVIALHSYGSLNTGHGYAVVNGELQHCEILNKQHISSAVNPPDAVAPLSKSFSRKTSDSRMLSTASGLLSSASRKQSSASEMSSSASGMPSSASGMPSSASGVLSSASGMPSSASGMPSSASGMPSSASGVLSSASGMPSSASGMPSSASGMPSSTSGVLSSASGVLSSATGTISSATGTISSGPGILSSSSSRVFSSAVENSELHTKVNDCAKRCEDINRKFPRQEKTERLKQPQNIRELACQTIQSSSSQDGSHYPYSGLTCQEACSRNYAGYSDEKSCNERSHETEELTSVQESFDLSRQLEQVQISKYKPPCSTVSQGYRKTLKSPFCGRDFSQFNVKPKDKKRPQTSVSRNCLNTSHRKHLNLDYLRPCVSKSNADSQKESLKTIRHGPKTTQACRNKKSGTAMSSLRNSSCSNWHTQETSRPHAPKPSPTVCVDSYLPRRYQGSASDRSVLRSAYISDLSHDINRDSSKSSRFVSTTPHNPYPSELKDTSKTTKSGTLPEKNVVQRKSQQSSLLPENRMTISRTSHGVNNELISSETTTESYAHPNITRTTSEQNIDHNEFSSMIDFSSRVCTSQRDVTFHQQNNSSQNHMPKPHTSGLSSFSANMASGTTTFDPSSLGNSGGDTTLANFSITFQPNSTRNSADNPTNASVSITSGVTCSSKSFVSADYPSASASMNFEQVQIPCDGLGSNDLYSFASTSDPSRNIDTQENVLDVIMEELKMQIALLKEEIMRESQQQPTVMQYSKSHGRKSDFSKISGRSRWPKGYPSAQRKKSSRYDKHFDQQVFFSDRNMYEASGTGSRMDMDNQDLDWYGCGSSLATVGSGMSTSGHFMSSSEVWMLGCRSELSSTRNQMTSNMDQGSSRVDRMPRMEDNTFINRDTIHRGGGQASGGMNNGARQIMETTWLDINLSLKNECIEISSDSEDSFL